MSIPRSSMIINLIKKKHCGGLVWNFGIDKILSVLKDKYYWLEMYKNIQKFVRSCEVCQIAKGESQNISLYTPISILEKPWTNISKGFVLGLRKTSKGCDSIFFVLYRFSKMTHFISCKKTWNAEHVSSKRLWDYMDYQEVLFLTEIVSLLVTFEINYGRRLVLSCSLVLDSIQR